MKKVLILLLVVIVSMSFTAEAKSYWWALRKATKTAKLYSGENMEAKIIWAATLFTPDFRRAYAQRHVKLYYMPPLEAARWIADSEREQAEVWEFFLAMYTKSDYKGLSMDEDSFWKLKLLADGETFTPIMIEKLPKTPYYKLMFKKYVNMWTDIYRVTFPKVPLGKDPRLSIYSIMGKSDLKWRIKK